MKSTPLPKYDLQWGVEYWLKEQPESKNTKTCGSLTNAEQELIRIREIKDVELEGRLIKRLAITEYGEWVPDNGSD